MQQMYAEDDLADDAANNEADVQAVREYAKQSRRVKYSLSVQRSKKRFQNWMMMRRRCSWKILDLKESGLEKLIKASYNLLGLMSFLTAGEAGSPCMDDHRTEQRHLRQPARSTQILKEDLSRQKL